MPMHPKQNLAAAVRALSSPFRCRSYPVDATPLLFLTFLRFAIPLPSCQRFAFASQNVALPRLAFALPVCASQCHCTAVHLIAFAKRCRAMPSPRLSSRPDAMPLLRIAMLCLCASSQITAMPLQCKSLLRCAQPSHGQSNLSLASANQDRQCHALALRLSPHRRCR